MSLASASRSSVDAKHNLFVWKIKEIKKLKKIKKLKEIKTIVELS